MDRDPLDSPFNGRITNVEVEQESDREIIQCGIVRDWSAEAARARVAILKWKTIAAIAVVVFAFVAISIQFVVCVKIDPVSASSDFVSETKVFAALALGYFLGKR